ncbi:MAG: nucleoside monophosphate kinase [Candidatus Liptonbacteria bacterium]|nr:nucleoside monophosphate kinase [Candidatus Liptonbacteria bacterium]
MKKAIFNLILLGDPAAGKATQAVKLLARYPQLQEFDFGNWLRSLSPRAAKRVKFEYTMRGNLTPTQFARAKFKEVIFTTPLSRGVFLNGNPKMLGEARLVCKWFREAKRTDPLVLYLSIPKREILKRIGIRAHEGGRSDDRMEHLRNRMRYYAKDISAVVRFFEKQYRFKKISGMGTRADVYRRLTGYIDRELAREGNSHGVR